MLGFVLVAVHQEGHREGEDELGSVFKVFNVAMFYLQIPEAFKSARHKVHSKLRSARGWLKQNGETTGEACDDYIPAIKFLSFVFQEAS